VPALDAFVPATGAFPAALPPEPPTEVVPAPPLPTRGGDSSYVAHAATHSAITLAHARARFLSARFADATLGTIELVTWRVFNFGAKDLLVTRHRPSDAPARPPIRDFQ
jgi:hypothetical protein